MTDDDRLRCRFCAWSTRKHCKKSNGSYQDVNAAYERLLSHVQTAHPEEHRIIQAALAEDGC